MMTIMAFNGHNSWRLMTNGLKNVFQLWDNCKLTISSEIGSIELQWKNNLSQENEIVLKTQLPITL